MDDRGRTEKRDSESGAVIEGGFEYRVLPEEASVPRGWTFHCRLVPPVRVLKVVKKRIA
jgi:hypothetical protein